MSVALKLRQAIEVAGNVVKGDLNVSQAITLTNGQNYCVQDRVIADNYTQDTIWQTGDGGLDTFTHGFLLSTQDLWVELRNTDSGAAEFVRLFVPANVVAFIPAKVAGNAATFPTAAGSVLVANTDYAPVDQIIVRRDAADAVGDATVSLFLFS